MIGSFDKWSISQKTLAVNSFSQLKQAHWKTKDRQLIKWLQENVGTFNLKINGSLIIVIPACYDIEKEVYKSSILDSDSQKIIF